MSARSSANPATLALLSSLCLLAAMIAVVEVGRRLGIRYARARDANVSVGVGSVESGILALLGLVVAFTFYGAGNRFDARRQLIVDEANAIGTAYLRVDALPESAQPSLRDDFRKYLDARLAIYDSLPDLRAAYAHRARSVDLQRAIWGQVVAGCQRADAHPSTCFLIVPAVNVMIDISTKQTMAALAHPPLVIFALEFWLAICASLIAGFATAASKPRRWLHTIGFTVMLASAIYITLDLEYPRFGYVQIRDFDQALRDVRTTMR
jgi:hypothetical protein